MILVPSHMIPKIDRFASQELGISTLTLMDRAGEAVARTVREHVKEGSKVAVFAGKGNNGGDGYAAALKLMSDYRVTVYDVFSQGQRTEEGKYFLREYSSKSGVIEPLTFDENQLNNITSSHCIIDAVFGTGYTGELPEKVCQLIDIICTLDDAVKVAIDVPLGIDADFGTLIIPKTYTATATVVLGFVKTGLVSYPARKHIGKLVYDNLGLQKEDIIERFGIKDYYIDYELAASLVPHRTKDSHKGTYGKLLVITGSSTYPGAAHLTLEAALRSGVGYVTYLGEKEMCDSLLQKYPEALYRPLSLSDITNSDLAEFSRKYTAILIGSGLGGDNSGGLYHILEQLLKNEGCPLVLDADAINTLAKYPEASCNLIANSPREVILTPHPLEFARLVDLPLSLVTDDRLSLAKTFASENSCTLVLKGAGTVVADGTDTYINSSGSSALAKAGSGDVLAGHLAALVALGMSPVRASALAVYLHGAAADSLSKELSEFGVIPSDLPLEIAKQIAKLQNNS